MTKYYMTDPLGEMILKDETGRVIAKGFKPVDKAAFYDFMSEYSFELKGELKRLHDELDRKRRMEGSSSEEPVQEHRSSRQPPLPPHFARIAEVVRQLVPENEPSSYFQVVNSRPCLAISLDGIIAGFERTSYNERSIIIWRRDMEQIYLRAREVCTDYGMELLDIKTTGELYDWGFAKKGEIGIGKWRIRNYKKDILNILNAYNDLAGRCKVPEAMIKIKTPDNPQESDP